MTSPPSILELWKQPAPTHAVVLGKGPSLDKYDPDEYETWIKFALNEAVLARPMGKPVNAHYLCFNDSLMKRLEGVPPDVIPIRGQGHHVNWGHPGYWFDAGVDIPNEVGGGTAGRTLFILGEWAKRHLAQPMEVLLVGCDAWDKPTGWTDDDMYAKCIPQIVGNRGHNYSGMTERLKHAAFAYRHNLVIRLFHRELEAIELAGTYEP